MKKTIKNPHWINNARTILSAEFHYEDGRVMQATITDTTQGNPDWDQIKSQFSTEEIEANTRRAITKQAAQIEADKQKAEADEIRKKNEVLFDLKLRAFELDVVKSSKDRSTKAKIRRAKSDFEIYAFVTKLIIDADAAPAEAAPESTDTSAE
jgi:hypothetical protein